MWSSKNWERYSRTILLTITCSACVSVILFACFRAIDKEKNTKTEIEKTYSLQAEKLTDDRCVNVCDSRNCIVQADLLLRSIKPVTDPCENFQEFLCGSYKEKFSRDEGSSVIIDMTNIMWNKLKNLIENIEAEPGTAASKLKIFYDSCVNLGSSELRGVEDIRQVLNNVEIHNWPYLAPDFEFSDGALPVLLATFRSYFEIKFLGFSIASASGYGVDSNDTYVKVDFNHRSFHKIPVIQKEDAEDILKYFDMESEDVDTLLNDVEVVRKALLKFGEDGTEYLDKCKRHCPDIHIDCSNPPEDVQAYICDMVEVYLNVTELKPYVKTNNVTIGKRYAFYVTNLIPRLKSLSDRSVANFFAFNFLWNHLSEVNFFFRLKMNKYFKYFGVSETSIGNKWEHCLAWITGSMTLILENEFVKSLFTQPYIDEVHDIHQRHTSAISKMIDYQEWITPDDKWVMKDNIKRLKCNMVFLKRHLPNDTYFNEYFKTFNPDRTSFLQNILEYEKNFFNAASRLELIHGIHGRRVDPKFVAGAFTNHVNEIAFYYGLLMPPVYYPGHEKFINMIVFAPMAGHEIAHSVIDRLTYVSRFLDDTRKIFFDRKNCLDKQFSNFTFKILGENLDGPRYFEENLSDNLGYAVTDKMIDELSEEDFLLPGLPYSSKQLLYMSSRQVFCSKDSAKVEIYMKTESHAPQEYRIIASGQNSKGYSKAFNCSEGSYMNPTEKCTFLDSA